MSEIILKSEISNEEIIKNKGNKKCIFYSDDICRNGDRTRDCLNCARVEYHSLYSLNWDNQERLQKQLKRLQAENEELKAENKQMKKSFVSHSEFMDILDNNSNINWKETAKENIYLINNYRKALEEIRKDLEQDTTCESRECGCDDYEECLKCVKETILDKINEVLK